MLKTFLTLLTALISIYGFGRAIRHNKKLDEIISAVEGGYFRLNKRLGEASVLGGLSLLRNYYGWVSGAAFVTFLVIGWIWRAPSEFAFWVGCIFLASFLGWFSIDWVIDHRRAVREFSKNNAFLVVGPLLLGVLDLMAGSRIAHALMQPLSQFASAAGIGLLDVANPIAAGGIVSLLVLVAFGFYYVFAWLLAAPLFAVSVFIVLLPIRFARFLAALDPANPFLWLAIFVYLGGSLWLTRL